MGRKRKIKLNEIKKRTIECSCGRSVEVLDTNVVSVQCCFCASHTIPLDTPAKLRANDKIEEQKKQEVEKDNHPKMSKNGKRLGRPPKKKSDVSKLLCERKRSSSLQKIIQKHNSESESTQESIPEVNAPNKTRKGRKKMEKKTKGKRGRKATVGAKVLDFVSSQSGVVQFDDILKVYSGERERLGKKHEDPKIEERNCRSTLYIMVRDGKLKEINKKSTYTSA